MKKALYILCALLIVIGFSLTVIYSVWGADVPAQEQPSAENTVPAESTSPVETVPPRRPADPGVIPPKEIDLSGIAHGVAWDMENLPDDLLEEDWAFCIHSIHAAYQYGRVTLTRADGRGRNGTAALAYNQNGELVLKDITEAIVKCRPVCS